MKYHLYKILVVGILSFSSMTVNATMMMGNLSYDDTDSHIFTAINGGKSYVGWEETLFYSYEDTLALTQPGEKYENYYLATAYEAAEFFYLATGIFADIGTEYDKFESSYLMPALPDLYGKNDSTLGIMAGDEGLSYLFKSGKDEWGNQLIGRVTFYGYVNWMTYHTITNSSIDTPDAWQYGMTSRSHTAWILVPEPSSLVILSMSVFGLVFARNRFKNT